MKKIFLLLIFPLIMATTCDDDDLDNTGFPTTYYVENNSAIDLFLISERNIVIDISSGTVEYLDDAINPITEAIPPTENEAFSEIKLYKMEDGNFILVYEQNPLDNDLWLLSEPLTNNFEYQLVITDDLID